MYETEQASFAALCPSPNIYYNYLHTVSMLFLQCQIQCIESAIAFAVALQRWIGWIHLGASTTMAQPPPPPQFLGAFGAWRPEKAKHRLLEYSWYFTILFFSVVGTCRNQSESKGNGRGSREIEAAAIRSR